MSTTHQPSPDAPDAADAPQVAGLARRSFLGYVVGGTTLVTAADWALAGRPAAALPASTVPSAPSIPEVYDLLDLLTDAARPTANLISITVHDDGTASFELPRSENGQGIVTSTAMIIAEELDLDVEQVRVTLAPVRPELLFNQFTGGSSTTVSTFTPIRVAAAIARQQLLEAASVLLGDTVALLRSKSGVVTGPSGTATYAQLARLAASPVTRAVELEDLKATRDYRVIGQGRGRTDAREAVTGRKPYVTDLQVPGALPTMVCRAPTLNGTPRALLNRAEVEAMPGVTDVAVVDTGIAVRAATFGQCIDAVRVVRAQWEDGPVAGLSDDDVVDQLRAVAPPVPAIGLQTPVLRALSSDTTFYFRSNSAMDTNAAIADVREDGATIWAGLKTPGAAQGAIARATGLPPTSIEINIVQGGGSFGRRLFFDGALEAAKVSQAMGKPVKLMWHRADDARVGRTHPLSINRIQATWNPQTKAVLSFTQQHTSVETDFRHGIGDAITAAAAEIPPGIGNFVGFSQTVFALTQEMPYDFGVVAQTLVEPDGSEGLDTQPRFNTGSMRNIYSPDVRTAAELMIDRLAAEMGEDPYEFRRRTLRKKDTLAVLERVAEVGGWGRAMPPGTAQGIAVHREYKGSTACLVEIDCRPETVGRRVKGSPEQFTGPRVTKVTFAVDAGLVINPRGLEAQMQGGINDGIALALTSSLHLEEGHFVEASWDNYFYTRQWNHAPDVRIEIMPSESDQPGGAGEAGVAASMAAVACAWARATGTTPTYLPVNHRAPRAFEPKPRVPPVPASPTDGLDLTS